jgi:hypothetical protein
MANSISVEQEPDSSVAKPVSKGPPQVVSHAAESGITILNIKPSTQAKPPVKTSGEETKDGQQEHVVNGMC